MGGEFCKPFRNPKKYMRRRKHTVIFVPRRASEKAALQRCLGKLTDLRSVLDVPCGPGRLFWYWKARGFETHGADLSLQMVDAAQKRLLKMGLKGSVRRWDVFSTEDCVPVVADIVASVRFAYYFTRAKRIELLQTLSRHSSRYVLVQYKTNETLRGKRTLRLGHGKKGTRKEYLPKAFCTTREIIREFREAGLAPLRVAFISEFSDRLFVLAEKQSAGTPHPPPLIERTWLQSLRRFLLGEPSGAVSESPAELPLF